VAGPKTTARKKPPVIASPIRRLPAGGGWQLLVPSWPLIVGLAVFGRLLAEPMALLNDPDTYLHIATGRWILAHGALPVHDPFSHSMPEANWISSEWLAQIILAAGYDHFGWGGVILITAAGVTLAMTVLTHFLLRHFEPLPALIVAVAAAALLLPHALARPHVLALPLLVLWAGLLFAARDADRPPPVAVLPVMVLWANLHGSFMFGLALAAFLGGEAVLRPGLGRSRRTEGYQWGAFLLAALFATLLTPNGVAGLVQPIRLIGMPALQSTFGEWRSPDFQTTPALELWIVGMLFVGFATGARLPLMRLLLLLGLVHMTLQHVRHADLLALVGPLAVAAPLGRSLAAVTGSAQPAQPSRLARWAARLARPPNLPASVLALVVGVALALPAALRPIARSDDAVTPAAALATAQRLGLSGPVLNSESLGGYLIFRGVSTFIDGRVEMYGNDFLARDYRAERGDETALKDILARYRIAWTLLLPQSGAVGVMDHLPGWKRVYADNRAVIHRRIGAGPR
jgi:hypothetical protein